MSVIVKSRWGEVVFFSEDADPRWDGEFLGEKAAPGVYFYQVNIKSNIEEGAIQEDQYLGTITLLR